MNRIVPDFEQRRQAIDTARSFIVRAPAGSGKTELLIQRYLKLLSRVDAPEEIVAITFTRKAAAEMQSRILAALRRASIEPEPDSDHARETWQLARAALQRDRQLDWQLERNPARLKVMTIDALCAWLTRQMPVLSGLGAQPETLEDAGELYEQAAIHTLAALNAGDPWSDSIARLLEHLDNDLPRVKQLIMAMLGKRDQWLPHVATDHRRDDLETALQHIISGTLERARQLVPPVLVSELCTLADFAAENLAAKTPDHPTVHCRSLTALPGHEVTDLPAWLGVCNILLTAQDEWRQRADARNGFPAASGNKAEAGRRADMKTRLQGLIQQLRAVPGMLQALQEVRLLPPPGYSDAEWDVVGALCQLLILAEGQLRLIFAETNQMDFTGVSHAALDALGSDEEPTDLALILDYRIRHLMVDEYQDISVNQFDLLQRLTAGWSAGDGHTVFVVGDPMQSIYRFREAEVGIFIQTWIRRRLGQVALEPVAIHTNFRSQPGLVDWVNQGFARIMPAAEDVNTGAVSYEQSTAWHNVQPIRSVSVYPQFDRDAATEAARLVEQIQILRERDADGSIAILVRSRSHLVCIIPALRDAGLAFQAVDIQGLATRPEVRDVLALIRALSHQADRIAWLSILRAPWCGLLLADLLQLSTPDGASTLWQAINDSDRCGILSEDSRRRLDRFRDVMHEAMDRVHRQPLHRTVETAWLQLGGPALVHNAACLNNVMTVLKCLRECEHGGRLQDMEAFQQTVAALFSAPEYAADSQLQLMTIHKAKGLEFDHVLLPGLGRKTRPNSTELLQWMQVPGNDQSHDLILAPIREAGACQAPVYDYISSIEKRKQENEDIRLLYVAATRAKISLHLFGYANVSEENGQTICKPVAGSFLHHLWPMLRDHFENALPDPVMTPGPEKSATINQQWRRLHAGWSMPLPVALSWPGTEQSGEETRNAIEFEWAGETIKHIGAVVHRCIQQIAAEGVEAWNSDRLYAARSWYEAQLRQLGVTDDELENAVADVIRALEGMLADERGRWILSREHPEQHSELALTGLYQNRVISVRIDRTFIDAEGTRWIIDYKTGRHEAADIEAFLDREQERYREQLEKYARILSGMEQRRTRLGLYFPLLRGWRCWDAPGVGE